MPNLTKDQIAKLTPESRERFVWDDTIKGFGVRVLPTGVKSYVIQYRNAGGATRRYTLCKVSQMTLKQARKEAQTKLAAAVTGGDPSAERKRERAATTINELCGYFLDTYAPTEKLSKRYVADCRGIIDNVIRPRYGTWKVKEFSRRVVEEIAKELSGTPIRANRALALLSRLMTIAVEQGARSDNPASGVRRNRENRRERYMQVHELERLFENLDKETDKTGADVVRMIVFTGARIKEVLEAQWRDFDLTSGLWTKPPTKTKQKREHRVHVSQFTLDMLKRREEEADKAEVKSDWVFPGPKGKHYKVRKFWERVRKKAELGEFVLYDARHTFASHLLVNGVPLALIGKMLGHSSVLTTERYAHIADDVTKGLADKFAGIVKPTGRTTKPKQKRSATPV